MAGLRKKQKAERQRRILEAARQRFKVDDYRDVKIEAIAEDADLSAMTIFNYYGSKGGLLLALVAESDRHLIKKINAILEADSRDAISVVTDFSLTIFDHAFSYLDRHIWGHVLATSIKEGSSAFGRGLAELEHELIDLLAKIIDQLKKRKLIDARCDSQTAAAVIYSVHNARFIEYASNLSIPREEIDAIVKNDLEFLLERMA